MASFFVEDDDRPGKSSLAGGNLALEAEAQRLTTLKRRHALGLQQMLSYELRNLAREERDRQRLETTTVREAAIEAKRLGLLYAAERARLEQDRECQERRGKVERAADKTRARQKKAMRRLEAEDQLRRRQDELLAQRRKQDAEKKATLLQSRIARSARMRNVRRLQTERLVAEKADAQKAARDAARRAREANNFARKTAKAARAAAVRTAFEEISRRRQEEKECMRAAMERKLSDTKTRVELSRKRQKEKAEKERALKGELTGATLQNQDASRPQHLDWDTKTRSQRVNGNGVREQQVALTLEIRKEQEAASRQDKRREKEKQMRRARERRMKIVKKRREATRRKLEEDTAKVELLRSEKERLQATHGKLSSETAKQREALKKYIEALKDQSQGCRSFDAIAVAVSTPTSDTGGAPLTGARTRAYQTTDGRFKRDKTRPRDNVQRYCVTRRANYDAGRGISGDAGRGYDQLRRRRVPATGLSASLGNGTGAIRGAVREDVRRKTRTALAHWPRIPVSPKTAVSSSSLRSSSAATGRPRGLVRGFLSLGGLDRNCRVCYDDDTTQQEWHRVGVGAEEISPFTRSLSPPRFNEGDVTSVDASTRKKNFADDLVRSYGNIGASSSQASLLSRAQKARKKGSAVLAKGGETKKRGTKRRSKVGHRPRLAETPHDENWLRRVEDAADDSKVTAAAGLAAGKEQHLISEASSISVMPQDALRKRYDCELLDVLENEQAAERVREEAIAAAKARVKASQARAIIMDHCDRALPSGATPVIAGGMDDDGIEAPNQRDNFLEGGGNVIAVVDLLRGSKCEVVGDVGSAADSGCRKLEEVAGTTQELKHLTEQLTCERRLASERIMRMSEAYEYAIRELTEQYQHQHHHQLSGRFALPSSVSAQ